MSAQNRFGNPQAAIERLIVYARPPVMVSQASPTHRGHVEGMKSLSLTMQSREGIIDRPQSLPPCFQQTGKVHLHFLQAATGL